MGETVATFGTTAVAFPGTGGTFTILTILFGGQAPMPSARLRLRGFDRGGSAAPFAAMISSLFGTGANLATSTLQDAAIPLASVAVSRVCDDMTDGETSRPRGGGAK